jgi:glycosyltransferase involved in cell wall biosynthesis
MPGRRGEILPGLDWTNAAGTRILGPMQVRAALLTPHGPPSVRGNAITVDRVARGLAGRGVALRVWDLSAQAEPDVEVEVEAFRPALVHAFHAYLAGPVALRQARRAEVPLVVTLTGTDVNHDLFDAGRAAVVRRVLEGAAALVVFHDSIAERMASALPDVRERVVVVPQAVDLPPGPRFEVDAAWAPPATTVLVLFPAGIRPVKRPRLPLGALAEVAGRHPALRLAYAGPTIDPGEAAALHRALAGLPWARHLGAVPHGRMRSLLERADVVLNCSQSEGGMANAVLEALACGRAVLASDIPGNRSLIEPEVTGLLFGDAGGLRDGLERLLADPALRARLGAAGRALVAERYPPAAEIDGYLAVYRRLTPLAVA